MLLKKFSFSISNLAPDLEIFSMLNC